MRLKFTGKMLAVCSSVLLCIGYFVSRNSHGNSDALAPENLSTPIPQDPGSGKKAERPKQADPKTGVILRPEDAATLDPSDIDAILDGIESVPVE